MQQIKDLLLAVMTVSFVSGIILLLCPEGSGNIKKSVAFVCSVTVCASLVSPLIKAVRETGLPVTVPVSDADTVVYEPDAAHTVIENAAELICSELEAEILHRYGQSVTVSLVLDSSDVTSVRILSASVTGEGDVGRAEEYVSETLGCAVNAE